MPQEEPKVRNFFMLKIGEPLFVLLLGAVVSAIGPYFLFDFFIDCVRPVGRLFDTNRQVFYLLSGLGSGACVLIDSSAIQEQRAC